MDIVNKIKSLGKWYQNILIDGVFTRNPNDDPMKLWRKVRKFLPEKLNGLRILDLGCNAGHYSCLASIEGAVVTGINIPDRSKAQAEFVREYFESKHGKLDIAYTWDDIVNIDFDKLGKFDYVFALAIIYHIGRHKYKKYTPEIIKIQKDVIGKIQTNYFIVKTRNSPENCVEWFDKFFKELNFSKIAEQKVGSKGLVLYSRNKEKPNINKGIINNFIHKEFNKSVIKNYPVGKQKRVFCAECSDGTKYRYEKYGAGKERLARIALKAGCRIAKTLKIIKNRKIKISEWIEGVLASEVWNEDWLFLNIGLVIGKINTVTVDGKFISVSDINDNNFVWTKERKLYLIDWNPLLVNESELDEIVARSIIKRIRNKNKIRLFLKGYSMHRNTRNIIRIIEDEHS